MIGERFRVWLRVVIDPMADAIARSGISPNALSVAGAAAHVLVAWLLAEGRLMTAALVLLVSSGIDGIDGTVARRTGQVSTFGAFLDSSLDRISEILVYLGLLLYAVGGNGGASTPSAWLVYLALTGSIMVSYTRARSEAVGFPTKVGLATRFERMGLLWLGLLFGQLQIVLAIIAVGAWLTAGHRILDVRRQIRSSGG
jgi:CDP-diacylglycerol--glycerol-3-phosphate 3-phosphatidyltransferase